MGEGIYKTRVRGGKTVYEAHLGNWRCTCWLGRRDVAHPVLMPVWNWEARRFGRGSLHVSGECGRLDHAKKIALAAARALTRTR